MLKRYILTPAAILVMTVAANAQQAAPNPPATSADAASQTEKPLCKSVPVTGSRFSKKVCHTKAEWDAIAAQNAVDVGMRRSGN
jgi:hypothetical protein